jgi:hypothetical protein
MGRTKLSFSKLNWTNLLEMAAVGILLAGGFPVRSVGQQQGQKTFSSPENAINALVTAAQNNDEEAMLDVLEPDGKQIVSSGDETEDAQNRANFVQRYQEMHRLVKEPDGTIVLYIGAKNWPTPIPLVNKGSSWYSTPMQVRKRFCLDELAGMKYRPFVFARSSWRRKRNITPQSTPSMPRKSSVMKGSTMVFIGRLRTVSPRARSGH